VDKARAKKMAADLKGKIVGGWIVENYLGQGKSAVVLRARKGRQRIALKVFDQELINLYGAEKQKTRIERETSLAGKTHKNLVRIPTITDCQIWERRASESQMSVCQLGTLVNFSRNSSCNGNRLRNIGRGRVEAPPKENSAPPGFEVNSRH